MSVCRTADHYNVPWCSVMCQFHWIELHVLQKDKLPHSYLVLHDYVSSCLGKPTKSTYGRHFIPESNSISWRNHMLTTEWELHEVLVMEVPFITNYVWTSWGRNRE
jgi:hypothetical protein